MEPLTLDSIFFHLLDFSYALPEVAHKAGAVLLTRCHKDDKNFPLSAQNG